MYILNITWAPARDPVYLRLKISEPLSLDEIDENDPFGRNIQAVNSPPITIYDGFLQPRMPWSLQKYNSCSQCCAPTLSAQDLSSVHFNFENWPALVHHDVCQKAHILHQGRQCHKATWIFSYSAWFSSQHFCDYFSKTFKNSSEKMACLQLRILFNFQICGTFLPVGWS